MLTYSRSRIPTYRNFLGRPLRGVRRLTSASRRFVDRVKDDASSLHNLSSRHLQRDFQSLRQSLTSQHARFDQAVLRECFAFTFEAVRRCLGLEYYDVQVQAGSALASGCIAEIQTGEGKTIIAALPTVVYALTGLGVHVGTTNEYLAKRDFELLAPVYETLGLSAGHLDSQTPETAKREAYRCDITYGPWYEFGFDYLRDQATARKRGEPALGDRFLATLAGSPANGELLLQTRRAAAVIDEADSVLIDEAVSPLLLSGSSGRVCPGELLRALHELVQQLRPGHDFLIEPGIVRVGQNAVRKCEQQLTAQQLSEASRSLPELLHNALVAKHQFQRDEHYIVRDGQLVFVDQSTGRLHPERRWRAGLHQAIEVKEGVETTPEHDSLARITRQRFARLYDHVCGLTGTAGGSESEFAAHYNLPVVGVPTHRPCQREHLGYRFFSRMADKDLAIVERIVQLRSHGRPTLIGAGSIQESQRISRQLAERGVEHAVLNGVQDAEEAAIVARAGVVGRVTVATNMAGRGTDIQLEKDALEAGGLHVIGSSFYASARVERQLAGRAARQGEPGTVEFFVSAEDDSLQRRSATLANRIRSAAKPNGESMSDLLPAVRKLQKRIDRELAAERQKNLQYDEWTDSALNTFASRQKDVPKPL